MECIGRAFLRLDVQISVEKKSSKDFTNIATLVRHCYVTHSITDSGNYR